MSVFDKLEYELYVPIILSNTYPEYVSQIEKGEHPDWQDKLNSIGIEVARAENNHLGYTKQFANQYLGKQKSDIPQKQLQGFIGAARFNRSRKLIAVSDSQGLVDGTRHIQLAIEKAKEKLDLLNKPHFQCFQTNCLFLYITASVLPGDDTLFQDGYLNLAEQYNNRFQIVFLLDYESLYRFEMTTHVIQKTVFQGDSLQKLQDLTHVLRKMSNWDEGTPFSGLYTQVCN